MTIKIIITMIIISVEKRKLMITGILIIMTKTVMKNLALLVENPLNVRMPKMKNEVKEKMRSPQKRIRVLLLTPILQGMAMGKILMLALGAMTTKTQMEMKRMSNDYGDNN